MHVDGMRANSLALRLFLSATAWAVIILLITGVVLSSLYRQAVERAFDRRLGVYLRTLVADVASPEEAGEKFPQSLGEPLFELPLSGWYWQVTRLDPSKTEVRASRSLWDGGLPHLQDYGIAAGPNGSREGYVPGPEDQRLRLVERNIDLGDEGHYLVAVAGDAAEISEETRSFDQALIITFSILAAVLLLTTVFQVRFGLAPLKRITDGLAAIRSGNAERLAGTFPEEIAPLARETNALIEANKEIVERARTHVGNLAHALKTPLSVMPLIYKITSVWGNHEGSMLLWVLILAFFGALVGAFGRNLPSTLKAYVLAVQSWIACAFYLFILFTSNPFLRLEQAPLEGRDLNPILQDIGLAIHPPLLYLGYVGCSIAFSFAIAALIEGRIDAAWARWVRPWMLAAWMFLTAGIAMIRDGAR